MSLRPELIPRVVQRLSALADETRLRLLLRLLRGEANVTTLSADLAVAQASVSKHLAVLRQAGLVDVRHQGPAAFYRVRDESVFEMCDLVCSGVRKFLEQEHQALGLGTPPRKKKANPEMSVKTITPAEVSRRFVDHRPATLIDVRTAVEYAEFHATGARLVPLDDLDPAQVASQRRSPDEPIYLICKSGGRSAKAAERFAAAGIDNVWSVDGGTSAWVAAALPVLRQHGVISLERQVRIAAGLLVLTGVILGVSVHRYFLALAGLVGAGLTFAGITDWCGMAMLLAKMPWNRAAGGQSAPTAQSCGCAPAGNLANK